MRRRWKLAILFLIATIIMARLFFDDDECEEQPEQKTPLQAACDAHDLDAVKEAALNAEKNDLDRALCESAKNGNHEVMVVLLNTPGINVNAIYDGRTAIYWAASSVDPDTIEVLLGRGADLSIKSINTKKEMKKPGDDEAVRRATLLLLDAGCDVNAATKHGYTLLFDALRLGLPIVDILLERGADPNHQDKKGNTPLQFCHMIKDRPQDFKLLMAHGAKLDIRSTEEDGSTPLHGFAKYDRLDIPTLQPYVSDWNLTDAHGNTLVHVAAEKHNLRVSVLPDLLKLGLDVNQRNNAGCQAIHMIGDSWGYKETLDLLLAAGADLESRDNNGRTLLARALFNRPSYQYKELVPHLVSRGANLSTQDYQGNGVLHYMVRPYRLEHEALGFLLSIGADLKMTNYNGDTLLHLLAGNLGTIPEEIMVTTMENLIGMGLSPAARNFKGQTPLHMLCGLVSEHHFRLTPGAGKAPIDILLDAGFITAINIPDNDGILPIHLAATISEPLVAKLISRGADTTAVTKDGRNLLHIASTARQSNIVGLLLDHYSSTVRESLMNAPCKRGRRPLHEASRSGRIETVALLLEAGANVEAVDKDDKGVLAICTEFTKETQLWGFTEDSQNVFSLLAAAGVLGSDEKRPYEPQAFGKKRVRIGLREIHSEHDTVSIAPIVRLLVSHGAKLFSDDILYFQNLLHRVISDGPEEMVVEIARLAEAKGVNIPSHEELRSNYLRLRSQNLPLVLENQFKEYISNIDLSYLLLRGHQEEIVLGLQRMSESDLARDQQTGLADFLDMLAQHGYYELFARVGTFMTRPDWIHGGKGTLGASLLPSLLAAAQRPLPNLEMIKVIVEKFNADINLRFGQGMDRGRHELPFSSRMVSNKQYQPGDTALHYIAQGGHWWHESAIKYLLEKGADPNAQNEHGMTPLYYAARPQHLGGYRQKEIVQLLLDGGADVNIAAKDKSTPLSVANHDKEIVQLLLDHGAK
ncbi:ankyrin repeat-containing domain protein [Aspergillus heterothallicus]